MEAMQSKTTRKPYKICGAIKADGELCHRSGALGQCSTHKKIQELKRGKRIDPDEAIEMIGVREHGEGQPVILHREAITGRMTIQARNEGGNNATEVDLLDLINWLASGTQETRILGNFKITPA